jgi:RNA polymerase sigma-70 factor (ECF subfamily)
MTSGEAGERGEAWFRRVFDDHYLDLRRFALRRIENRSAIEDVLAETFGIAWRRRSELPEPPGPWLAGVCLRVIANHRRSARRLGRLRGKVLSQPLELGRDPADVLAERSEIARAFSQLAPEEREVLRLVAWDGMSSAEAADVLDCTPGAFRVRLSRARSALAKHLGPGGHGQASESARTGRAQTTTET